MRIIGYEVSTARGSGWVDYLTRQLTQETHPLPRVVQTSSPIGRGSSPTVREGLDQRMDLGLKNKVALVAAASRGLGRAVAEELAAEGAALVLCSRKAETINQTANEIAQATGT